MDSLDTLWLMGLYDEYREGAEFAIANLTKVGGPQTAHAMRLLTATQPAIDQVSPPANTRSTKK